MAPSTARSQALQVLTRYRPGTNTISTLLTNCLTDPAVAENAGFVRDLVWGVVRYLNALDWLIDAFTVERNARLDPRVRVLLRLGLYQVLYAADRIPAYAAVHESVDLAKSIGGGTAAPLVNAVLRRAIREQKSLPWPDAVANPLRNRAIMLAHPAWMIERWLARWGEAETDALCRENNTPPPLTIRTNTLTISREALQHELAAAGIGSTPCRYAPDGLVLQERPMLEGLPAYQRGCFVVQDEASQVIAGLLDIRPGITMLDLCAGAGIKATHCAQLAGGNISLMAIDSSARQLARAEENCRRLGITSVVVRQQDVTTMTGLAVDRILLDVPCSGLGALRRKPDIKWNRKLSDIRTVYPAVQQALLTAAARLLKPGGLLVYSTCTTEPEENEQVVSAWLSANPGYHPEPVRLPDGSAAGPAPYVQLLPSRQGTDGFFAAKIRRDQ
jgi:16S rRNA (cytosine967-C5)-methyltransferase